MSKLMGDILDDSTIYSGLLTQEVGSIKLSKQHAQNATQPGWIFIRLYMIEHYLLKSVCTLTHFGKASCPMSKQNFKTIESLYRETSLHQLAPTLNSNSLNDKKKLPQREGRKP